MNKNIKFLIATLAFVTALATVTACGGGDDGSSVSGSSSQTESSQVSGSSSDSESTGGNSSTGGSSSDNTSTGGNSSTGGTSSDSESTGDSSSDSSTPALKKITGVTLTGLTVEYDTKEHSIQVVGDVPSGVYVDYTYNGQAVTGVTEVGKYTVVATLHGEGYETLTLTETVRITSKEEQLFSINHNGTIYFQNNLDSNKLYTVTDTGVKKVNNDTPQYFTTDGTTLYYYSASLLSKTIKTISGTKASTLYSVKGEYLTTDGTYIYYAVNNILLDTESNGIYRLKLDGSDEAPTRLTTDKAAYLCYYDGYIYYSNLTQDKYLYRISTGETPVSTCLWEEEVEYLLVDEGVLYFNSTAGLLKGSAVRKYNISSGTCIKLTTDAGKYLTKIGSYIYYVNDDFATGNLFGKNICKVSALKNSDSSMPGTIVLAVEEDGFSSLTSDGEKLYYYRLNDKHFYSYDENSQTETDMMKNFVVADNDTISGEARIAEYGGEIYYTNPKDASCLYKYNPTTNQRVKVLADSVAGVWFNGNKMYYSTYILTNYALWEMDMQTKVSVKVSSNRYEDLIFEGTDIYCLRVGATGSRIVKLDKDFTETELYNDKNITVTGMTKVDDTFYFVINPIAAYKHLYSYTIGDEDAQKIGGNSCRAFEVIVVGTKLYYFSSTKSALMRCDFDGNNVETLVEDVTINDLFEKDGAIYFSSTDTAKKGVYKYVIASGETTQISTAVGEGFVAVGNNIWFIQTAVDYDLEYPVHSGNGDGGLYVYDGANVTKKA